MTWEPGEDPVNGISRGEMLIELSDTSGMWILLARETPSGVYVRMRRPQMVLTPAQTDALEEFLARVRGIREKIGSVAP